MKYGPFRKALEHGAKHATSSHDGATGMFHAIQAMIKNVDLSVYKDWTESCGRNVGHHSGPLPILLKMGILQKLRGGVSGIRGARGVSGVRGARGNVLEVNGRRYQVVRMTPDVKKNLTAWTDSAKQGCHRVQMPRLRTRSDATSSNPFLLLV